MIYELLNGIWIANYEDITIPFLKSKHINVLINVSKELVSENNLFKIEQINIPLNPFEENTGIGSINHEFIDYVYDCIRFIHKNKVSKNILIYSTQNNQRPISIIIAYLIHYGNIKPQDAIHFMQSKCENNVLVPKPLYLSSFFKIYEKKINS